LLPVWIVQFRQASIEFFAIGFSRLTPFVRAGSCEKTKPPQVSDENLSYDIFAA
jgi:hypothetical protein